VNLSCIEKKKLITLLHVLYIFIFILFLYGVYVDFMPSIYLLRIDNEILFYIGDTSYSNRIFALFLFILIPFLSMKELSAKHKYRYLILLACTALVYYVMWTFIVTVGLMILFWLKSNNKDEKSLRVALSLFCLILLLAYSLNILDGLVLSFKYRFIDEVMRIITSIDSYHDILLGINNKQLYMSHSILFKSFVYYGLLGVIICCYPIFLLYKRKYTSRVSIIIYFLYILIDSLIVSSYVLIFLLEKSFNRTINEKPT
jgi:hypothetical protein